MTFANKSGQEKCHPLVFSIVSHLDANLQTIAHDSCNTTTFKPVRGGDNTASCCHLLTGIAVTGAHTGAHAGTHTGAHTGCSSVRRQLCVSEVKHGMTVVGIFVALTQVYTDGNYQRLFQVGQKKSTSGQIRTKQNFCLLSHYYRLIMYKLTRDMCR